jgi:hypothetical protein
VIRAEEKITCAAGSLHSPRLLNAGKEMDRANDRVGRGVNELGALHDMAERGANIAMAASEEIEGVGVTVEGAAIDD